MWSSRKRFQSCSLEYVCPNSLFVAKSCILSGKHSGNIQLSKQYFQSDNSDSLHETVEATVRAVFSSTSDFCAISALLNELLSIIIPRFQPFFLHCIFTLETTWIFIDSGFREPKARQRRFSNPHKV